MHLMFPISVKCNCKPPFHYPLSSCFKEETTRDNQNVVLFLLGFSSEEESSTASQIHLSVYLQRVRQIGNGE